MDSERRAVSEAAPSSRSLRIQPDAIALGALMVAAVALRLPGVLDRSLWLDEAWRANVALAPTWQAFVGEVLRGAEVGKLGAPMPPLFALALRLLALTVGPSAAGLRMLPLTASVLAVPLAYAIGRRWFGRATGLAAALCFACYPLVVVHGQELKQYATDVLVVLVVLWIAGRIARAPDDRGWWATLAAAAALAPAAAYPAALVLPGIALGLLTVCRTRRVLVSWIVSHAIAAGIAVAWYALAVRGQSARPLVFEYWAAGFPPEGALLPWAGRQLVALGGYALASPAWLASVIVLAGYLFAPLWMRITAGVTLAVTVAAAAFHLYPFGAERTSLYLVPFLYLPFAAAAVRATQIAAEVLARVLRTARPTTDTRDVSAAPEGAGFWVGAVRSVAVATAAYALVWPAWGSWHPRAGLVVEETRPLIERLRAERQPTDRVYVYNGAVPAFRFYHPGEDARVVLGGSHRNEVSAYEAELRPLLIPGERLWLLFSHVFARPETGSERDAILNSLRLYGRQLALHEAPGATLHLFEVTRAPGTVRHIRIHPGDPNAAEQLRELPQKPDAPAEER